MSYIPLRKQEDFPFVEAKQTAQAAEGACSSLSSLGAVPTQRTQGQTQEVALSHRLVQN